MGFVRFAAEEKQLFRWLYLEGKQQGPYQKDVLFSEVIAVIEEEFGYSEAVAAWSSPAFSPRCGR